MDNQALRPSFYKEFTANIEDSLDKEPEDEKLSEEQKALSYITHFKGWDILEAYAERLIESMDNMVTDAIANGLSTTEIGERTMAKELSKFALKSFVEKANAARRREEK